VAKIEERVWLLAALDHQPSMILKKKLKDQLQLFMSSSESA